MYHVINYQDIDIVSIISPSPTIHLPACSGRSKNLDETSIGFDYLVLNCAYPGFIQSQKGETSHVLSWILSFCLCVESTIRCVRTGGPGEKGEAPVYGGTDSSACGLCGGPGRLHGA